MDDTDDDLDLGSVMNVMLPLELYKLPSFASEHSFIRLYQLFITHFAETHPQPITPSLLFSISEILSYHVQFCSNNIIPLVLRRLRTWRLLAPEERTRPALESLAMDLAALANARSCPTEAPRMKITWIRAESETDLAPKPNEVRTGSPQRISTPSSCLNGPLHDTVSYRSGCCACRQPRNHSADDASGPVATLPLTQVLPSSLRKTPRKTRKHEDGENVPTANAPPPHRKPNPGNIRTKPASLSRSSFSYNSSTKNASSHSALPLPRPSSSLAPAQPPASHAASRTGPTKLKAKVPLVPVSRAISKPGGTRARGIR